MTLNLTSPLVVVTDLDGTLLDHHSYSFAPALAALTQLKKLQIPLILCSSKTTNELLQLRIQLDNQEPFVTENGASISLPQLNGGFESIPFSMHRNEVLKQLHWLRKTYAFKFTGFADMDPSQLSDICGLSLAESQDALARGYSEPLLWQDSDQQLALFRTLLVQQGLTMTQGGRFMHVSGAINKGDALSWLRTHFAQHYGSAPFLLALGDSENDIEMLESADFAVVVRSPVKAPPKIDNPQQMTTEAFGPRGWNQAVLELLAQAGLSNNLEG